MEHKIGEVIEFNGKKLKVVRSEFGTCKGCFFFGVHDCEDFSRCTPAAREDDERVIYKEVEEEESHVDKANRVIMRVLGEGIQSMYVRVQNALEEMLPYDGDSFILKEEEINPDITFVDYEGADHIFGGIKRVEGLVTLLGWNETYKTIYPVRRIMYEKSEMLNVIRQWWLYNPRPRD